MIPQTPGVHPAWLPDAALATLGAVDTVVLGDGPLVDTVRAEVAHAATLRGGEAAPGRLTLALLGAVPDDAPEPVLAAIDAAAGAGLGEPRGTGPGEPREAAADEASSTLGDEGFVVVRSGTPQDPTTTVLAETGHGLLHGWFHLVREGALALGGPGAQGARGPEGTSTSTASGTSSHERAGLSVEVHRPTHDLRVLDHWDNISVHPVMGQVERGYSGGSLFYDDGSLRPDLGKVRQYARLLAASGVNRVALNNVNVGRREAELLTTHLDDVVALAGAFRPYGVRVHLSVSFASPVVLGGLATADPADPGVQAWWAQAASAVYAAVPDFGGFVVKADSEGQPGPFSYGRDHADGANMLARALAPHGGTVHWRAFVYDHHQDWRDRSTDRARAAYDHFTPLDGRFDDNVVLQVKLGPVDFQVREPLSPVVLAMPQTRVAVEVQVTQEYTGQQKHVAYLAPQWTDALQARPWGDDGPAVSDVTSGTSRGPATAAARTEAAASGDADSGAGAPRSAGGGLAAVSNVGDDVFWTGHPFAQANLYAFGRLAWDPTLTAEEILDEWVALTFGDAPAELRSTVHDLLSGSLDVYEQYTAPLGVGFMVSPTRHHYGPDVDGYEYTAWGTYHFADRDGVGVDRSCATGTGFAGLFPLDLAQTYESLDTCPDELLLFLHHVPYSHVLHSGKTVVQHIYDTHFAGVERVEEMLTAWEKVAPLADPDLAARVTERLAEQHRSAVEWRDQINTYFFRKSGVPDERGRKIY
ncbi:alpha-glucuronidase [Sanguibacter sp. 4.1]|uniref:Alpha-glucuronidase n=1 Tax=Sanguibacter biliveldensis TaxID=3030830 RepID=A0AAF0Z6Q4_9MICO|nr:alpha-glucuronidase [Sanguibacter sp. 4.1]WPF81926.1 alpha-glucuronidase [Sanguibacter sp. 4.1]